MPSTKFVLSTNDRTHEENEHHDPNSNTVFTNDTSNHPGRSGPNRPGHDTEYGKR